MYDPPVKILDRKNEVLFYGKRVGQSTDARDSGSFGKLLSMLFT